MKRDADWISMFGCDEIAPLQNDAPALPLDDELFQFRATSSDAGNKIVSETEDSALMEKLVGECRDSVFGSGRAQPATNAGPLTEFAKRSALRLQEIEKQSPRRKQRIRKMLQRFADQLPGRENEEFDYAFDRLADSCLRFVTQTCLMEA